MKRLSRLIERWILDNARLVILGAIAMVTLAWSTLKELNDVKDILGIDARFVTPIGLLIFYLFAFGYILSLRKKVESRYINKDSLDLSFHGRYIEMKNNGPEVMEYVKVWLSHVDANGVQRREEVREFYERSNDGFSNSPSEIRALREGERCRFVAPMAIGRESDNIAIVEVSVTGSRSRRKITIRKEFELERLVLA